MRSATLSRLELRIIRTLLEAFPRQERLAYTTVQTVVNRLEAKGAIRRVDKISNAHVFEAAISQASAQHRMLDELVAWFGGKPLPIMTHLIESGRLTDEEVREARKALHRLTRKEKR